MYVFLFFLSYVWFAVRRRQMDVPAHKYTHVFALAYIWAGSTNRCAIGGFAFERVCFKKSTTFNRAWNEVRDNWLNFNSVYRRKGTKYWTLNHHHRWQEGRKKVSSTNCALVCTSSVALYVNSAFLVFEFCLFLVRSNRISLIASLRNEHLESIYTRGGFVCNHARQVCDLACVQI